MGEPERHSTRPIAGTKLAPKWPGDSLSTNKPVEDVLEFFAIPCCYCY